MKTASVGQIQKNLAAVLSDIESGEEVIVTRHGKAVAKIVAMGPKQQVNWPDFSAESIHLRGEALSEILIQARKERF